MAPVKLCWAPVRCHPCSAGNIDRLVVSDNTLTIEGWLLLPGVRVDSVTVFVNGQECGVGELVIRKDVGKVHPWDEFAEQSGFRVCLQSYPDPVDGLSLIQLVGVVSGSPACCYSTFSQLDSTVGALPTTRLAKMIGSPDRDAYIAQGLKVSCDLLTVMGQIVDSQNVRRILDWGCGCGRVTAHLLKVIRSAEVYGCDIVEELIDWCTKSLPNGSFCRINPSPPTPYEDSFFNIVIGTSVFTHLDRKRQHEWLDEIHRILAPGGIVLASTLGEYAFLRDYFSKGKLRNLFPKLQARKNLFKLRKKGILDGRPNPTLDHVTATDYYRDVFQTTSYTAEAWGKHFEILDHLQIGLGGYQDLVIMTKGAAKRLPPE